MSNWQIFFSTYGSIIAGFFAAAGVCIGIISSVASSQVADKSKSDLKRAVQVIERLETVIGDQWDALDAEQVETLRKAIVALPFKGRVSVMYQTSLGKSFAQSIATAFRAAQWEVSYSTGSGFEVGVEYGRGPQSTELGRALALASGEDRGGVARVPSSRLSVSDVELAPIPGQELIQFLDGMLGDASQDIGEPGLRINVVHFGRDDQAVHHRGPLAASVGAAEQPRLPT